MTTKKKKISVQTLGCRLNQYESEKIAAHLYPYGFERANQKEAADIYIINTCTVTHKADADCRAMIRRASRQNPNSKIVVTGCYVDNDPALVEGMEAVDLIVNNAQKDDIARIVPSKFPELFTEEPDKSCSTMVTDFFDHNRAWLKISDGCNQWCSFCIIPTVRGRIKNRAANDIIDEINMLVENGYNEVVLTAVHIGHYKNNQEPRMKNLTSLCKHIMAETDLYRLRVSSIEPQTVRDDFIEMYADSNGRICRHMHLPLQAGSSQILKKMLRPYDQNRYINRVELLKKAVPNTIIGADVIVGFPGETDEDFMRTAKLVESGLIDYLHVFSYSDREGTPASQMSGKIDPRIIKERNAYLTRISNKIKENALKRQIGQTLDVISEHKLQPDGHYFGVSDNYLKVKLPNSITPDKSVYKVKINASHSDSIEGELI